MKAPALLLVLGPACVARLLAADEVERVVPDALSVAATTPTPAPEIIALGERVFQADCATCHVPGKAGAPRVGHPADWTKRLAAGRDTLVHRAIHGHSGPEGDEMPARGGNDELGDAEVAAAVDHILRLVRSPASNSSSSPAKP